MRLSDSERRELGVLLASHAPRLPRRLHELFAKLNGYFWLPCPLCGEEFGGHEWRDIDGKASEIPDPGYPPGTGRSIGICPSCTRAGRGISYPLVEKVDPSQVSALRSDGQEGV